jgi:hypothetical protein
LFVYYESIQENDTASEESVGEEEEAVLVITKDEVTHESKERIG